MKVVVQNCKTKLFFCNVPDWTEDIHAARQFTGTVEALKFVNVNGLEDIQLVLTFPNGRSYDVVLPVSK